MYATYKRLRTQVVPFQHSHLLESLTSPSMSAALDAWLMFTMGGEMY